MAQDEIGLAFRDVLSTRQRRALAAAGAAQLDEWFAAIGAMAHGDSLPHATVLAAALPPSYRMRLTPELSRRFHTCLTIVLWKLAQPEWLGLRAVIDRAVELLGPAADFGAFEDDAFADVDHE